MCHPNQSSASSPTSSLSTSPVLPERSSTRPTLSSAPRRMPRRADRDVVDAVAVEIAGGGDHAAELLAELASRPVPQLLSRARRVDEDLARERARLLLFRGGRRHGEVALAVAVEVGDRRQHAAEPAAGIGPASGTRAPCRSPTRGSRRRRRRAPAAFAAVGAPTARSARPSPSRSSRRSTYQPKDAPSSVGVKVRSTEPSRPLTSLTRAFSCDGAPRKTSMRPSPFWSPASARSQPRFSPSACLAPPDLVAALRRARHDDAAPGAADGRERRGDDHVRQAVAGEVRHERHPVAEHPVRKLAVPRAQPLAGRAGEDGRAAVLEGLLRELPARAGGDVRAAVTVGVERLAETEAELAVRDVAGEPAGDAPAGPGRRARGRRVRVRQDRNGKKNGGGDDRTCASPAPKRRRRAMAHWQQPTHLLVKLHC